MEDKKCEKDDKRPTDDKAYERYRKVLGCILRICELSGFHLEERVVLKDLRTGKVWK